MAEDFAKLFREELAKQARASGQPAPTPPSAAITLCRMMGSAFQRYEQHVLDCQQTANKAYAKAQELEKRVAELERV